MATIINTVAAAEDFDKDRHSTKTFKVNPRFEKDFRLVSPIVQVTKGGHAALRLIGSPDSAEWVKNGVAIVAKVRETENDS